MTMLEPGCQPSSRRPRSKGSRCSQAGSLALPGRSTPTRATFAGWARAGPAARPSSAMRRIARRFTSSGGHGQRSRLLLLLVDQALHDAAHRHPRLVLAEADRGAGAQIHVLLLRLDHRHVLEEDGVQLAAHLVAEPGLV